jgi:pyruvate formate lyase activating enzyme
MTAVCAICPFHCRLAEGQTGLCRARGNRNGKIVCLNYGRVTSLALDPIEKKPLAHFDPGGKILSVGSFGCNLRCAFCQNSAISMVGADSCDSVFISPEELVEKAVQAVPQGNIGLAYTYNEPLVGYEYVTDCAKRIHAAGLKNVLVTNGMICKEPWEQLLPFIDAVNIDIKGFTQEFYDFVGGDLETVKRTVEIAAKRIHVEVTTLIIPGKNDSAAEMQAQSAWLASIDENIPLHISRFFPRYRYTNAQATPIKTIEGLVRTAKRHLTRVYPGNC